MGCAKCAGGYWACGPDGEDACDSPAPEIVSGDGNNWTKVGEVDLLPATDYWMKCKPGGCESKVEADGSDPAPGWKVYGPVQVDDAGTYGIYCRKGGAGGGGCQVAIKKAT